MSSETLFNFMFTGLMSFGNPPFSCTMIIILIQLPSILSPQIFKNFIKFFGVMGVSFLKLAKVMERKKITNRGIRTHELEG